MPEGPEIRRAADKVASAVENHIIVDLEAGLPDLSRQLQRFRGKTVTAVETRGKAMLTHFEHGWSIYSHNQLYGVWKIVRRDNYPKTNRSLRLALHTEEKSALLYSASDISFWKTDNLHQHPFLQKLGPDILNPELDWRQIRQRLLDVPYRNRSLASLYLNQGFLAGIGNYLRSDIIFDAMVNPFARPRDIASEGVTRLARSTLQLARRSYMTGGITNPPALVKTLKLSGASRAAYRHRIFGRDGQACHACGSEVQRIEIASRRLYWCPTCQEE